MKKFSLIVSASSLVLLTAACGNGDGTASGGDEAETVYMTVGAPPASSALYGYWVAAANSIESVYPEFSFTITETQGAVDITERVKSGSVPLGNSVSSTDYDNYNGVGSFEGEAFEDLRIIWYFDVTPQQWIVTEESGVESLAELEGQRFNPGSTNSSAEAITRLVFEDLNIQPDYFDAVQSDAADAVVNRQIIGTSKAGPAPDSFIQQIQGSLDINLLGMEEQQVTSLTDEYSYMIPYEIEGGTYEGIDENVHTVATMMGAQATSELSQENGYKMIKAMWEDGKDVWTDAYPAGAEINIPELTLDSPVPLHAGTVQYLKELGMDVPEDLIPPEYEE